MKSLFILLLLSATTAHAEPIKCKGTRADNQPCKSTIVSKQTGYCNAHNPSAKHCTFVKKDGQRCRVVVKTELCRFHSKG